MTSTDRQIALQEMTRQRDAGEYTAGTLGNALIAKHKFAIITPRGVLAVYANSSVTARRLAEMAGFMAIEVTKAAI